MLTVFMLIKGCTLNVGVLRNVLLSANYESIFRVDWASRLELFDEEVEGSKVLLVQGEDGRARVDDGEGRLDFGLPSQMMITCSAVGFYFTMEYLVVPWTREKASTEIPQ